MTEVHNIQNMLERRRELRARSTAQEKILWEQLRNRKLGVKFRRQHSIGGYIADFYCFEKRLIIEIDGLSHEDPVAQDYDATRDLFLSNLHHTVLRFKNQEVDSQLENVLLRIVSALHPSPNLGEG